MTVHLLRMAAGIESIAQLVQVQRARMAAKGKGKAGGVLQTYTRNIPRRSVELLDGGSIYWVFKRFVRVRQAILGMERRTNADGRAYAALMLDPQWVRTELRPQKAFQGWRYLRPEDAPGDLVETSEAVADMPPELLAELKQLGLI